MSNLEIFLYIALIWFTGFIGGMWVLIYDYRSYDRDVKMMEFLENTLWTFIAWPTIIHYIILYAFKPITNMFDIDFSKFKDITIVKGKKK